MWLIAEDETDILSLLTMVAQVWGYQTLPFESGQKVWEWLDKVEAGTYTGEMPQFALMDIRMPGKKGNEVANRMRTISAFKHMPLVLMTAFSLSEADQKVYQVQDGVDAVIAKPLPAFDELRNTLTTIIANKQVAQTRANQS
jgi:CheY-like chemotaxis protein